MILYKMRNELNKTDDFIKNDKFSNKPDDFIKSDKLS